MATSENFDQITRLAAFCFNVPSALILMVDLDQCWFCSSLGIAPVDAAAAEALCRDTIRRGGLIEIPDLAALADDAATSAADDAVGNARVLLPPGVDTRRLGFYAGIALVDDTGRTVGALSILDTRPRTLRDADREQLTALGRLAMTEIALRQSDGRRDAMTGLPNERQLVADLHDAALLARGEYRLLVFVDTFDVASARALTQTLGSGPIDALMVQMAERLKEHLEGLSDVYRVAETRFGFVTDCRETDDPEPFIAELSQFIGRTALAAGIPIRPAIRAGLVKLRLREEGVTEALRQAEAAVDASVASNRTWTAYDAEKDAVSQRSYTLATGLERALANNEFYLVYQPRLNMRTGRIASVEALVRWKHSVLGTLFPGEFIPIVERTALMQALTHWVANASLAQLAIWQRAFPELHLSINLSSRDFETGELTGALTQACERHRIAPGMLEVEVKEGDWVRGDAVFEQLTAIRAAGILVAIDDFGSGFSNSGFLRDVPADVLKIDPSLILDLADNERHQTIVRSILDLGRELGYRTVAEGVESEATLALLREWQCEEAQGYLIARPVGANAIGELLHKFAGTA
ncbi:GGDEF domain-containing phosphodiesterase [Robbsia sp. Bb-Pol-6]|uniref:GGDEF domain-containing phosphodiesterase n=1 Tax=Robbsia betulipollinis TaxID=2981849 RepID=A0ABT3ZGR4_9BURK|nr:GGDEF domain-containing phosphodiesterase [Robbsia betulipollinis]MCY0385721.1 GGDEF domain-containing phosphodiesterase [Robbsia betulipollinis]